MVSSLAACVISQKERRNEADQQISRGGRRCEVRKSEIERGVEVVMVYLHVARPVTTGPIDSWSPGGR